jgi:hypothetical protein
MRRWLSAKTFNYRKHNFIMNTGLLASVFDFLA